MLIQIRQPNDVVKYVNNKMNIALHNCTRQLRYTTEMNRDTFHRITKLSSKEKTLEGIF